MKNLLLVLAFLCACSAYAQPLAKKKKPSKKDHLITITTEFGLIRAILYEDTPVHKANFIKLATEGFYDSTTFHRVLKRFVIQGGDPNTKPGNNQLGQPGTGGPGYTLEAEIRPEHKHEKGVLAAARQGDAINPERRSSGSQFYIVQADEGTPHLDNQYTVFGKVVAGMDIVDAIADQKVNRQGLPEEPIYMTVKAELMKKKDITKMVGYEYPELQKRK